VKGLAARAPRLGLVLLLLIGGGLGIRWVSARAGQQKQVLAVCDAVGEARYADAIAGSEGLAGPGASGRVAAECRCWALLNLGRRDECAGLIDGILGLEAASDWVPHPVLAKLVIRTRRGQGKHDEAAALARRLAARHPADPSVLQLEIMTRASLEGEARVLAEMEGRIQGAEESYALRLVLAVSHARRGDTDSALRVLGVHPPPLGHPLVVPWFEERIRAQASAGDLDAVKHSFALWQEQGGDPVELRARYALRLSVAQLEDPARSWAELLREALDQHEQLRDPQLRWGLYRRLIALLVSVSRVDEALAVYDEAALVVEFPNLTRAEIERSALAETLRDAAPAALRGALLFALTPQSEPGGVLLLSPDVGESPDSDYEEFKIEPDERLRIDRSLAATPQRWVYRDADARVRASGSVWPQPGQAISVLVEPRERVDPPAVSRPGDPGEPGAGDGRRRIVVIVPDCADWRLVQYLRARDELPFLDSMLDEGYRAVLESSPAFTAAAMEALVWPTRGRHVSFLGLVQRMGLELGGLASVGENPLRFLSAVLPEEESLFDAVGAGRGVAANLLFSHGGIDAGRNAELVGPHGARRLAELPHAYRVLTPEEKARFPELDADPKHRRKLQAIAAELDAAVQIVEAGEVDLLLLRLEALDLLTHAFFGALVEGRQDDGEGPLLEAYRYIDARLAELHAAMDRDDLLIVLSDHGIRTAMEHEEDAIFVAVGEGVPRGRASGMPRLDGVPRVLAQLMGVEMDNERNWPDSGLAPWAEPDGARLELVRSP
jgi:hypothetical protein